MYFKKIVSVTLSVCYLFSLIFSVQVVRANSPEQTNHSFIDVSKDGWYYDDVSYVYENDIMKGTSYNTFSPGMTLSRAMCVTILYRLAGEPDTAGLTNRFSDVPNDEWYTDAILWAKKNAIVFGTGNGLFKPNINISRAELSTMFFRYITNKNLKLEYTKDRVELADYDSVPDYAKTAVGFFYRAEIVNGKDTNVFDSKAPATRAEAAAIINRFMHNAIEQDFSLLDKYGLTMKVNAEIYDDYAWDYGLGYKYLIPNFSVALHKSETPTDKLDIMITAKISDNTNTVNVELKESTPGSGSYRTEKLSESAVLEDIILTSKDEIICVDVTITIDGESATYQFYPLVSVTW